MARPRKDSAAAAAAAKVSKTAHRKKDGGDEKAKAAVEGREKRVSRASASRSPEKRAPPKSSATSQTSSNVLSVDSLAKLNALNEKSVSGGERLKEKEKVVTGRVVKERGKHRRKRRVVSGAVLEEGRGGGLGRGRRGGNLPAEGTRRRYGPCFWIVVGVLVLLLVILIPVGVLVVGKNGGSGGSGTKSGAPPSNSNLKGISPNDIPVS